MKRTNVVIVTCLLCIIGVGIGRYYSVSLFPAIAGFPALAVLWGILEVARLLASLPFAHVDIKISLANMLAIYFILASVLYVLWNKTKQRLGDVLLLQ